MNYCKPSLNEDIEVNPGPTFTNYSSTICAAYSQGDVDVFCESAGRQCVAMSLCSLIRVYCQGAIPNSGALVYIMNMGNELYSMLSRFSRQQYLLLSEMPTIVSVDNSDYSLELIESYTDDLHLHHDIVENIAYVIPLDVALEELQNKHFNMFLLTIEYNTMSIFFNNNGFLKL